MIALLLVVAAFVVGMLIPEPKEQAPVKEDYDFKIRIPERIVFEKQDVCEDVCGQEIKACC
jgi:hypothetical protein